VVREVGGRVGWSCRRRGRGGRGRRWGKGGGGGRGGRGEGGGERRGEERRG